MSEEPYKFWQKLTAAGMGISFVTGTVVLLGVLLKKFPSRKNDERER